MLLSPVPGSAEQGDPLHNVQWRTWPPPELLDVPRAYVVEKLREVATTYWDTARESSNCTLGEHALAAADISAERFQ